jgi:putative transposase
MQGAKELISGKKLKDSARVPKIGTDNGPQFISSLFNNFVDGLGMVHEMIPVKMLNMNTYIDLVLEDECYRRYEFESFMGAYGIITEYMRYYNERRRHGSIKYVATNKIYEAFVSNGVKLK